MRPSVAFVLALVGCTRVGDWQRHTSEESEIRVAAYRHFLVAPDSFDAGVVNCLGVQKDPKAPPLTVPIADEGPETLAALRSDRELVRPASACRQRGRVQPKDRNEVAEVGVLITIESVERPDEKTAIVGVGVLLCDLFSDSSCEGSGHRLHMARERERWVIETDEPTWDT